MAKSFFECIDDFCNILGFDANCMVSDASNLDVNESVSDDVKIDGDGNILRSYINYGVSDVAEIKEYMFITPMNMMYFYGLDSDKYNSILVTYEFPKIGKYYSFSYDFEEECFVCRIERYKFKYDIADGKIVYINNYVGERPDVSFMDIINEGLDSNSGAGCVSQKDTKKVETEIESALNKFVDGLNNSGKKEISADVYMKERDKSLSDCVHDYVKRNGCVADEYKRALEKNISVIKLDVNKMKEAASHLDMQKVNVLFDDDGEIGGFSVPLWELDDAFPVWDEDDMTATEYTEKYLNSKDNEKYMLGFIYQAQTILGFECVHFDEETLQMCFYF